MTIKHSQSQQNMQGVPDLLDLLQAATGEAALSGALGHWRQAVSTSVDGLTRTVGGVPADIAIINQALQLIQQQLANPPQAAPKPFGQSEMTSAGAGQLIGPGSDVLFDGVGFGDIPYNPATGVFSLGANKRYRLTAHFSLGNYNGEGNNMGIEWVDAVTNAVLHDGHGALCTSGGNPASINANPTADTFHATSVAQGVKCRVTTLIATATALPGACSVLVEEI